MKLYAVALSPFAARVRLALRIKGLAYDMVPPPGGSTRSPEFLAINPIGKLPVLVTDDGVVIPESETIIDYLEDVFPAPSLLPADRVARARMTNAVRTFELYATPAMLRLFKQMDPAVRDTKIVEAEIGNLRNGLALTAHFVDDAIFAVGGAISKADCVVLPSLLLCDVTAAIFDLGDIVAENPVLANYREKARRHADMGAIWDETAAALAEFRSRTN